MIPNSESQYGVVKRMREIRDEISEKTMNMTFEELKAYYRKEITEWIPDWYDEIDKKNKNKIV
jgi:hypothetical protein